MWAEDFSDIGEDMDSFQDFTGHLIFNYRTKHVRYVKKLVRALNSYEFSVRLQVRLKLPEVKEPVAKGEFELSQAKVTEMFLEDV